MENNNSFVIDNKTYSTSDIETLKALEDAVSNYVPFNCYSVLGYAEDAVCIDKEGIDGWKVYLGSRGCENSKNTFDNLIAAGLKFISRLSDSTINEALMKRNFIENLKEGYSFKEIGDFLEAKQYGDDGPKRSR